MTIKRRGAQGPRGGDCRRVVRAVRSRRTARHICRAVDTHARSSLHVRPGDRRHHPRFRCASRLRRHAARRLQPSDPTVLRITEIREMTEQGGIISVLKLEGNIQGQWVKELRRVWRASRRIATVTPLRVVLADIGFVDAAGKVLLSEMHRDGVDIVPSDTLTAAIRDDIYAAGRLTRSHRRSRKLMH
jgi:hypothetical protein